MTTRNQAIGVFDSGVGGLTVLKALREALPHERTVYLGDTARVPYGTKSPEVVARYSVQNGRFLLERDIKLLVVACNTASSVALPAMQTALPVPVLGVIEPGARTAAERTRGGAIGVLGTPGTIRSGAYQAALARALPNVRVRAKACPLFVPLAEEGWTHGLVPKRVAEEYLQGFADDGVDTVVLGCTHYPLLQDVIREVLGPEVVLVDSAEATARAAFWLLSRTDQLRSESAEAPDHRFFVTDVPERFQEVGERFLGRPILVAEQVDISFARG